NMDGRFTALPGATAPPSALIVDDVYTTGATLFAASDAVRAAGARTVRCLTFARVL
ncbi:ComF family protein, partial [Eggerthella sinensis]